ncbi:hypothetical protein EAI_15688 [Harpegnathos saltator]|uniref:Uncharacterized protein n=1 Tax=Harpegnathos saltator TaxID=610380 RepID=E2B6Y3_HARSA|nr:hypothetical protein EAI_15688 [Harpegnathos saltator]
MAVFFRLVLAPPSPPPVESPVAYPAIHHSVSPVQVDLSQAGSGRSSQGLDRTAKTSVASSKSGMFHRLALLAGRLATRSNTSIVLAVVDPETSTRPAGRPRPTPRDGISARNWISPRGGAGVLIEGESGDGTGDVFPGRVQEEA